MARRRPAITPAQSRAPSRLESLDAMRGLALLWMTAFHFCFDLAWFRLADWNFYTDPRWTVQRSLIVGLFLLVSGLAQAVGATRGGAAFWRRWGQIAGCALLVSIASWWAFPHSFISFGVLHGIALMTLLLRPLLARGWPPAAWMAIAGAASVLPLAVSHPVFDTRWLNWVGLVTAKPITEDYLPLLPWLGAMCLGVALGRLLNARAPRLLSLRLPAAAKPLAVIGRHSLLWYMLHQPILLGGLTLYVKWAG